MGAAELVQTAFEVFRGNAGVPIEVAHPSLGMAYGIPEGTENTVANSYAPWHPAEVKQVFYRESTILGTVLADIQMIMRWRYSEGRQYIINVAFETNVVALDPTTDVSIKVTFDTPAPYDVAWEAFEIPFHVDLLFDPVGGSSTSTFSGNMRADGSGYFNPEHAG